MSMVPRRDLPFPLTSDRFDDPVKVVTIPLPVVAESPNEGVTTGGLAAFLLHDRNGEVDTLVAPQVNYNPNFGTTGTLYGTFYLSPARALEVNLSRSTNVNDDFEVTFRDKTLFGGKLALATFLFAFTDGAARFYGFGPGSPRSAETNFGDREIGFALSAGYTVVDHIQIVVGDRYRDVDVVRGAVQSLPFTRDAFAAAEVPGLNGFTTHAQRVSLVYDTRDQASLPTRGIRAEAFVEESFEALGSSSGFTRYGLEAKGFFPVDDARYVTAVRFSCDQVRGSNVPFLERSILGGEDTLRGFGRNRFIDRASVLASIEERIRIARWELFHVTSDWEVAPFLDVGVPARSLGRIRASDAEVNPGIGFRGVVRPNIVGRIDVGYGHDGVAVFVGLGYPF